MAIKLTIRSKLLLFSFVIMALPVILVLCAINFQVREHTRRSFQESIQTDLHMARGILEQRGDEMRMAAGTVADLIASYNPADLTALSSSNSMARSGRASRGRRPTSTAQGPFYAFISNLLTTWKLDFLVITDAAGRVVLRANKPGTPQDNLSDHLLVRQARTGRPATGLIRESSERLTQEGLEEKARIQRADGQASGAPRQAITNTGLCIETAVPILDNNNQPMGTVLAGGLLNNDVALVDEIKAAVYRDRLDVGFVSLYLDDYMISTNFSTGNGRALGWRAASPRPGNDTEELFGQLYVTAQASLKDPSGADVGKLQVAVKDYWYQQSENQFRRRVFQVAVLSILVFLVMAAVAARRFTRPILNITEASNRISLGELDTAVEAATGDEVEVLAESVERMRLSLKAALDRLKKA